MYLATSERSESKPVLIKYGFRQSDAKVEKRIGAEHFRLWNRKKMCSRSENFINKLYPKRSAKDPFPSRNVQLDTLSIHYAKCQFKQRVTTLIY